MPTLLILLLSLFSVAHACLQQLRDKMGYIKQKCSHGWATIQVSKVVDVDALCKIRLYPAEAILQTVLQCYMYKCDRMHPVLMNAFDV